MSSTGDLVAKHMVDQVLAVHEELSSQPLRPKRVPTGRVARALEETL